MHLPWYEARIQSAPAGAGRVLTSVTYAEAAELARLAAGRTVLEVGAAYGFSACVMALGGARSVTSVDHHGDAADPHGSCAGSLQEMKRNLFACGVLDRVEIVRGRSQDVLPGLPAASYGLVFIDGDHRHETVLADMTAALALAAPGGVIACHDWGEDCCCPEVRKALDKAVPDGPGYVVDTMAVYQR